MDFTWGVDANSEVYTGVLKQLAKYNPTKGAGAPPGGPHAVVE
jgi:hypothetical protein